MTKRKGFKTPIEVQAAKAVERSTRSLTIRLRDEDGLIYRWTIRRVPRAINANSPTIGESRVISGWEYVDHENYTRFSEGNWLDLVAHVKATAENYGLTLMSELS